MKMYDKKSTNVVEAVDFYSDGTVLVYDPNLGARQNGNGWITVKRNRLIPADYAEMFISGMSKTEKNKIKDRLRLYYTEWMTSDGEVYKDIDLALNHEKQLMESEKIS